MNIESKIVYDNIEELKKWLNKIKVSKKKIVLCHGHFNVIHPGHLRFLEFAKKHGYYLIIALQGRKKVNQNIERRFFSEKERARGVAALQGTDKIFVYNNRSLTDIIKIVKPDVYVLGEEFSNRIGEIKEEIDAVESFGGKVRFGSGEIRYSDTDFFDHDYVDIRIQRQKQLKEASIKQNLSIEKISYYCGRIKDINILVIGDSIVDQYIACDALGMSAEAPVLVIRELESKEFVGGAAVVSRHVVALGAGCTFISIIGPDEAGKLVKKELNRDGVKAKLIVDEERPTTYKIRYMVGSQKILRVSRLKDHYISKKLENKIIEYMESVAGTIDGIIVSDFVYGVITPRILEYLQKFVKKYGTMLFGDSQSSSQIGNFIKFINYDLLTPTEKEARLSLDNNYNGLERLGANFIERTKVKRLVITLADRGFIAFEKNIKINHISAQHFPALTINPIDVVGAGDAALSAFAVSLCAGASLMEASVIASGIASIAVNKIGNVPVGINELENWLKELSTIVR